MTVCRTPLPVWFPAWEAWRLSGAIPKERPLGLPARIPQWSWDCLKERRPKPVYVLPFEPPVAFYRAPNDTTIGPSEAIPQWKAAGGKAIAIDPLVGLDWSDWIRIARAQGLKVYGWSRIYEEATLHEYELYAPDGLDGSFPNIEDDDLRDAPLARQFLANVAGGAHRFPLMGVLTNYFVSNLWPVGHALAYLPVLPEWFPREITDPTATLEGSLASGRKHFAAALPLLDGRERGLEAFPYRAGAFSIWPADSVTDFKAWSR